MKPDLSEPSANSIPEYELLATFDGEPNIFWGRLCAYAAARLDAESVCLLVGGGAGSEFRVLAQAPVGAAKRLGQSGLTAELRNVRNNEFTPLPGLLGRRYQAMSFPVREGLPPLWMVAEGIAGDEEELLIEAVSKEARALADLYQSRRHAQRSEEKLLNLSQVMDLGLALGESGHFQEAALRLCNELAAPMRASRVSLAWMEGQDLKLSSTSHGGRISSGSQEALALQQVMEEAADQDNEVAWPELAGTSVVSREHRKFSTAREAVAVASVPLRHQQEVVGLVCLERAAEEGVWTIGELERVRLLADLVAPRLQGLHGRTGWIGKRIWRSTRRKAAGWLGPDHTGWKLAAVLSCVTLVALAIIHVDHQVKAPFILKTDAASLISAPFPGFIDEAAFHVGDIVKKGDVLVRLDRTELLLEEADTVALRNKSEREVRSNQGEGKLAQMLVSQAEMRQAEAKLAVIRHRLQLTELTAPFDGVIVEGDLRERLSSPVQTGELLLKVVQIKDLFGQLQVDERDISYLSAGLQGDLAFASRPGESYSVKVDRFEPVAEVRAEGTVFVLRAQVLGEPQAWWRPGMSGLCKIATEKRSLLWIGTHRLVEALRLWFWI
ncbi:HlyD family efflux transporter periplasmic adaptor subunit [Phragmitibacter flavus]|uniref:HlyD family efflux transporter periplasmic adaptor subunit n=1 Tax=Phragmitibacter flavus TaxID=2576071 RepID=A0A5R8KI83_9BACT|nr:efflux RND transporter periplasmic adaptor subunit [Phragmitibacter flavus]TLD71941.1 HlyD family efflux transporter periplasmic adaptor subunit [Phragmitibacter flavus]